ncbi:gluconate permease [Novacetimonas hansenii]|uniref:Gluconate permease n=1 Tax=Novacetimonas hansenii ATCC 23769 TaxID=714995 RepID=D5QA91_NOVHA|nr:gluconate:H+ symporter [Novacetimonas hansenii]EFG85943.1 gluconate permease [Novacetimonas hansenii ATCC 23769]RFP04387.1 gluconate permease [Novacetimonas hansenii]WEQ58239.1 gluconate:H+ symporter [Novacetimonas hansenii]CUW48623.1 Gnt-II system L-idonate transporter [Novacetimonas hansenii]GBQ52578.1 gluconate permease [Novacetimonas hansenii NRIC 0243]
MPLTHALAVGGCAIGMIIVLIARFRLNALLVLFGVAIAVMLATGHSPAQAVTTFQHGAGNALGNIGFLIAFGTMFGKLIAQSGAADTVARSVMQRCGVRNLHWAMAATGMIVGLPIFFDVGFVLLAPLGFIAAQESRRPVLMAILPLVASLSIAHAVMPPHPAIMLAIGIYHARLTLNLMLGLLVMLPTAILCGPVFAQFVIRHIGTIATSPMEAEFQIRTTPEIHAPPGRSVLCILLPFLLIGGGQVLAAISGAGIWHMLGQALGETNIALLVSLLAVAVLLCRPAGMTPQQIAHALQSCLAPTGFVILLVGAGGGFGQAVIDSGISAALTSAALGAHMSPLLLAFLSAAIIRLATGSATVATGTAANLIAPALPHLHGVSPELLVLATGAGSIAFGPVNDPVFWQLKEYLGLSLAQTFVVWSGTETLISIVILCLTLLLSAAL